FVLSPGGLEFALSRTDLVVHRATHRNQSVALQGDECETAAGKRGCLRSEPLHIYHLNQTTEQLEYRSTYYQTQRLAILADKAQRTGRVLARNTAKQNELG